MKVIVFSDSHGLLACALQALAKAGPVDLVLHAGDHHRDGLRLATETGLPVKAVAGNCDRPGEGPQEELLDLAGHRILLAHGHMGGGPKYWEGWLLARAREYGAQAVVFGHTHAAKIAMEGGILLFNPGSITMPRDQGRPSYGILEIGENTMVPSIHRV
ncbi:MAG: metallophosphoesterase [Peptococcaceae bacterium]|nr:metallophosphoesterase [Peptococcaceae bacterium]